MTDTSFLMWLHQRLVIHYGENELYDYMRKLRAIIRTMDPNQDSDALFLSCNSLGEMVDEMTFGTKSIDDFIIYEGRDKPVEVPKPIQLEIDE